MRNLCRLFLFWAMTSVSAFSKHDYSFPFLSSSEISLQDELLSKATLLSSNIHGGRRLEEHRDDDDYFLDDNQMLSFSGFSLKYAKCQTIQRFSEDAIKNGEYSAMVKDDIVLLRLCPTNLCSSSKQFGCNYNYAEYAIGISEYVKIMLKYTIDKRNKMCSFCEECSANNRRRLDEEGGQQDREGEDNQQDREQDGGQEGQDDREGENQNDQQKQDENEEKQQNNQAFDDDDYYKADDDAVRSDNNYAKSAVDYCSNYEDDCQEIANWCDGAVDDDVGYLDYADYLDYLDCVKVEGNDNYGDAAYWIRPRCDSSKETIHMDIYYDPYCSQYAGNDVNLRQFSGIYFRTSLFESFANGTCIDCSQRNYGPYYDANSMMCNRLHVGSARCSQSMMYQVFDEDHDTSTECSFIESVLTGTYNEKGEIYVDSSLYGEHVKTEVTNAQQAGIAVAIILCVGLGIYSCYLHHSITNLLIKSLSHSHLLPPSRHRNRGQTRSGSNGRADPIAKAEDDWDRTVGALS